MSDNEKSFQPDPYEEMVDKESRNPFQPAEHENHSPSTEQIPISAPSNDDEVFYSERRYFKAFFKRLWWPKTFGVGAALVAIVIILIAATGGQWSLPGAAMLIVITAICFAYPVARTRYWWVHRYIEVSVRKGQALITLYEPRSRFYGFKGDDEGISFSLSGNIAVKLNHKTWWELYVFRKCGGGMIDTPLQEDDALHNLRDIYRPDLLKQAIEDAVDAARSV